MVHYIRLLRTPQVSAPTKKGLEVSAVATVTTDLGDSFYPQDVTIHARVVDATKSAQVLASIEIQWQSGMRAVKINIPCSTNMIGRLALIHLTTRATISDHDRQEMPAIVDIWSASLTLKARMKAETLVERRLPLAEGSTAHIWEETGDSIARHIWDASFGCLTYFNSCFMSSKDDPLPLLRNLLTQERSRRLRVLEVGAGCGIVGISLSQLRKSDILLTDLEDAQDIMQSNVHAAAPASGSFLRRQVLCWGAGLDDLENANYDLVLVSDCIYNPDSSVLLVETLKELSVRNPDALIFVAFKRRHDADNVFFESMKQSDLRVVEQHTIKLPHHASEYDVYEPEIETFVYRKTSASD